MAKQQINKKDLDNFLSKLTDLTRKYKTAIGGCGCCGSPYIFRTEGEGHYKVFDFDPSNIYLANELTYAQEGENKNE